VAECGQHRLARRRTSRRVKEAHAHQEARASSGTPESDGERLEPVFIPHVRHWSQIHARHDAHPADRQATYLPRPQTRGNEYTQSVGFRAEPAEFRRSCRVRGLRVGVGWLPCVCRRSALRSSPALWFGLCRRAGCLPAHPPSQYSTSNIQALALVAAAPTGLVFAHSYLARYATPLRRSRSEGECCGALRLRRGWPCAGPARADDASAP